MQQKIIPPWMFVVTISILLVLIAAGGRQMLYSGQDKGQEQTTLSEEGTDLAQESLFLTHPPIDRNVPERLETATFALGWFWGPDARFGQLKGVVRTRVGYAGGEKENPTYRRMGDHTETLQIDYDPDLISYETLLEMAWNSHNPIRQPFSRQYMNIIFVHDAEQEKLARESKAALEQMKKRTVSTEIVSFTRFYPAEDYHQKYYLQSVPPLMDAFEEFYPQFQDFVDSTAAARINGYVAGHGDAASLSGELETLGLSTEGAQVLLERMKAWVL